MQEIKTIRTIERSFDNEVNKLLCEGWEVLHINSSLQTSEHSGPIFVAVLVREI